jgi:hypothetical protein
VITKPHERGGHIPCWTAEPEKIAAIIIIITIIVIVKCILYAFSGPFTGV